jgi:hypothetical protein
LLLDGAEQAGLNPLDVVRFHRLVFLANCLSPAYDLEPQNGKVYKQRHGPLYTDVQWDLDRMTAMGLVSVSDIGWHSSGDSAIAFSARYAVSKKGIEMIDRLREVPSVGRQRAFLLEVAAAYGSLDAENQGVAALQDATYSDPDVPNGEVIDFGEWQVRNFSVDATDAFDQYLRRPIPLTRQDRLYLYFRYLNRVVAAAQ